MTNIDEQGRSLRPCGQCSTLKKEREETMKYYVKNYFTDETVCTVPDFDTAKSIADKSEDRIVTDSDGYILYWNVILPF